MGAAKECQRTGRQDERVQRHIAAMEMKIVDMREQEEKGTGTTRRTRDAALTDMLEKATLAQLGLTEGEGAKTRAGFLADLARQPEVRRTVDGPKTVPLRFLGQLTSDDGRRLQPHNTLGGKKEVPNWLKVVYRICGGTGQEKGSLVLPETWRCSVRGGSDAGEGGESAQHEPRIVSERNRGMCTGELSVRKRADSAVRVLRRTPQEGEGGGAALPDIEIREGERRGYEETPTTTEGVGEEETGEIDIELMSDGTGGGEAAGLAWATVWHKEGESIRGTGFVPGKAESHRSELGGMCRSLTEVLKEAKRWRTRGKDAGGNLRRARVNTDCEGAQKAAEWALHAPISKILRHKNRALLLEWRWLRGKAEKMGVKVVTGWIKAHTQRRSWPHVVQAWCDEFATEANDHGDSARAEAQVASRHDAPFMLWDRRAGEPVWGGWGEAVVERTREELVVRGQAEGSTAAEWMRLRASHFTTETEWDRRPLAAKHGAIARGRTAAQWDAVNGPHRWTSEEQARRKGTLNERTWTCRSCGLEFSGSWAAHATEVCAGSEEAREYVDGLAGMELVRQMAMDPATVQRAWERWGETWMELRKGGEWNGFRLREVTLPGPAQKPRSGVGATDAERAVFSPAEKRAADQQWALDHPEGR